MQPDSAVWPEARSVRSAAASSLLHEVSADARVRLLTGVAGPGGSGKSTLLDDLEAQYRTEAVKVRRSLPGIGGNGVTAPAAVLIDDAHELGGYALERIQALIDEPGVHLVVAYRTWPQVSALKRLTGALEQYHAPVVLGPWSREEIAAHVSAAFGAPVPATLIERIATLTGGMPWLVHRVTAALRQHDRRSAAGSVIPQGLTAELGYELSGVDSGLRRLLLAVTVGFDLSAPVPPVLQDAGQSIDDLVAQGQAAGLLLPDGTLPEMLRQAVLESTPDYQVHGFQRSLVDVLSAQGHSLKDIARQLGREGLRDARVARTLETAGDAALPTEPVLASALYGEAASAGADELATAARRAQAAAAVGELDEACRIVDDLFTHEEAPDLRRAVDVAAAAWAQRGMLATSAQMYGWLGAGGAASSAPLAAVAMIGAGDRKGAEGMLGPRSDVGMPSLSTMGATLMGEGIRDSLEGSPGEALSKLIRASDLMTASAVPTAPLPESPAVLAALVALHNGDLDIAGSTLDAALEGGQGGPAMRPRLLLLKAWAAMRAGRPELAQATMTETAPAALTPRDLLLLNALKVGIARRAGDSPGLVRAWKQAREDILHISVDLYSLLPLGELVVAAARVRDSTRLKPHLTEAWALLNRLGDPPLWAVPLHWSAVQAAILAERPAELAPHATALVRASSHSHLASVLAAAGKVWMSVLAGKVKPDAVESAARGLAAVGLPWDGSRLAGQAAPRAEERKDMTRLLACARELHPAPGTTAAQQSGDRSRPVAAAGVGPLTASNGSNVNDLSHGPKLSAREREVARLVLEGKTYREIGAVIFISPRTAEHHVARMRRRLGATSRSELLHQLRAALDDGGPGQ
ncbi:LuxR C-terminal-related transcriptional regulator [Arthrobacter pigmenti]